MAKKFSNIREIIEYSSVRFKDRVAFKIKEKKNRVVSYDDVTYERLRDDIQALSKYFIAHGLQGKRIAVIGKNSYEWMLVFLAVLCSGGVIVPLDKGLFECELNDQLDRAEADAIFYPAIFKNFVENRDMVKICTDEDEFRDVLREGYSLELDKEYKKIKIDSKAMSILVFTSGTTSESKAVMLSQKNIAANVYGMSLWEKFTEDDVNMAILPFHHTFGMTQIVLFLSYGMCNVFCEGLRIAKCLSEYKVTVLVAVPRIVDEMYASVIKKLTALNKLGAVKSAIALSTSLRKVNIDIRKKAFHEIIEAMGGGLRCIIVGAAPANPDVLKWFNDIGILAIQGYGLTETSPVVAAENETHMRTASVGFPLPNVKVKIFEPDENGIGEIIVKGDNVMLGYYKNDEATAKVMRNGYFHTGDMGYFDKKGYLYITGRQKNVIVLNNGKNVFPEELEQLLSDSPAVKECIVFNKDDSGKDCIYAKIVYNTEFEFDKIQELVNEHIGKINKKLTSYKQIRGYDLTDQEMEKTTTLKIKRR